MARDFNQYPAGKFYSDGPYPGEGFREKCLVPALKENDVVTIVLDGVPGYSLFVIRRIFCNLARHYGLYHSNKLKFLPLLKAAS